MTAIVTVGDAASLVLPDTSVDLVVTSPPYWSLRSYTDNGEHYTGQIGAEPAPHLYLQRLWDCTREWMRVLKPGGSIFVNLGDKYAEDAAAGDLMRAVVDTRTGAAVEGKSLLMLPQRYAIGCVDRLGLICRAEIVWAKPNAIPESVTDRVRKEHEQLYHLVKQPNYYTRRAGVRVPYRADRGAVVARARAASKHTPASGDYSRGAGRNDGSRHNSGGFQSREHPEGRLIGSVWTVAATPLRVPEELEVDHFASYPAELVRRAVVGWSPRGGVVLDPFGGSGTTALVASVHGRVGISVDRSVDYCRLARWRTSDPQQRERVA